MPFFRRWLWLVLIPVLCVGYQLLVHVLLTESNTASVRLTLALVNGVPHAAINAFMLWVFGRTLARGREALITAFARRVHGTLPPHVERYTRQVTIVWCVFFAAQIVASAVLLAAGSLERWSLFVNVLSFPLVAGLFVVEYLFRISHIRNFPHVSLWEGMNAFARHPRSAGAAEPRSQN